MVTRTYAIAIKFKNGETRRYIKRTENIYATLRSLGHGRNVADVVVKELRKR